MLRQTIRLRIKQIMNKTQIKSLAKEVKKFLNLDGEYALATRLFITNKLEEINEELFFELEFAGIQEKLEKQFLDYNKELSVESTIYDVLEYFYFSSIRHGKAVGMDERFLQDILNTLAAKGAGMYAVMLAKRFSLLGYSLSVRFDPSSEIALEEYFFTIIDEIFCFTEILTDKDKKPTQRILEGIHKLEMNVDTMLDSNFYNSLAETALIKAFYNDKKKSREIINILLDKKKEVGIMFGEEACCSLLLAIFMFKNL